MIFTHTVSTWFSLKYNIILPRQQNVLHATSKILMPLQRIPPHEGAGLLHVLTNFSIPPPHVLLHLPTGFHKLHRPLTTE